MQYGQILCSQRKLNGYAIYSLFRRILLLPRRACASQNRDSSNLIDPKSNQSKRTYMRVLPPVVVSLIPVTYRTLSQTLSGTLVGSL